MWQGIRDWFRPADEAVAGSQSGSAAGPLPLSPATPPAPHSTDALDPVETVWTQSRLGVPEYEVSEESDSAFYGAGGFAGEAILPLSELEAVDEKELLEFLAADLDPVPVDPVFRERLREELWDMVRDEGVAARKDH